MSVNGTDPPPGAAGGPRVRGHAQNGGAAAAPMRVLALDPAGGTFARCAGIDGIARTIETALVAPLEPGAIVLVKAGLALARLDTEWAL